MRTITCKDTTFHYNGDLSGEVIIQLKKLQFKVSGEDLKTFSKEIMRDEVIRLIEENL